MEERKLLSYIQDILENIPSDWLNLTTHRLDIYEEKLAKVQFLEQFENLYEASNAKASALSVLPTAYDYIRLGHPLSCVLEWTIAKMQNLPSDNVISFSSKTTPILAILRKNLLENKDSRIVYTNALPASLDIEILRSIYGYKFEVQKVDHIKQVHAFNGSTIFVSSHSDFSSFPASSEIDFFIHTYASLGSILIINGTDDENYVSAIQHMRRRETIAMTPSNCLLALDSLAHKSPIKKDNTDVATNKALAKASIKSITESPTQALIGSSGLSIQYALSLIHI